MKRRGSIFDVVPLERSDMIVNEMVLIGWAIQVRKVHSNPLDEDDVACILRVLRKTSKEWSRFLGKYCHFVSRGVIGDNKQFLRVEMPLYPDRLLRDGKTIDNRRRFKRDRGKVDALVASASWALRSDYRFFIWENFRRPGDVDSPPPSRPLAIQYCYGKLPPELGSDCERKT